MPATADYFVHDTSAASALVAVFSGVTVSDGLRGTLFSAGPALPLCLGGKR